jgi:integrase/recombinase XerD
MLNVYRLHTKTCTGKRPRLDRSYRRCQCPIHVEGQCGQEFIRQGLRTSNWQQAQQRVAEAEARGSWAIAAGEPGGSEPVTLGDATNKFLKEAEHGRRLNEVTLKKYHLMLRDLTTFAAKKGYRFIKELGVEELRDFRDTWSEGTPERIAADGARVAVRRAPLSPRTAMKKLERVRAFFRFCHESGWTERNPAKLVRGPSNVKEVQKLPFEPEEMERILAAVPRVQLLDRANDQLATFILVMRYSGLRISDTALLTAERLKDNDLYLYTQKSGSHVYVPLPPFLIERLNQIPPKQGKYYFVWESLDMNSLANCWRRKLEKVFHLAGIQNGHPHRFRHTFAVELLKEGVPIEDVSILLGHSSIRITEKHYAAWVRSRQDRLRLNVTKDVASD